MINLRKCIKCGKLKASTEYYKHSGNTCKECCREYQRIYNLEKRLAKKEDSSKAIMDKYKDLEWGGGANVWVNQVQVMAGGVLIGQRGQDWWEEKIQRHKKWLRRKRRKEEIIAASGRATHKVLGPSTIGC